MVIVIEAAHRFRREPEVELDYTDIDTLVIAQKIMDAMMHNPLEQLNQLTIRTDNDE